MANGALNHCSKVLQLLKMVGSRKLSSAHSSGSLFCSGVPVSSTRRGQVVCVQHLSQFAVVILHTVAFIHYHVLPTNLKERGASETAQAVFSQVQVPFISKAHLITATGRPKCCTIITKQVHKKKSTTNQRQ